MATLCGHGLDPLFQAARKPACGWSTRATRDCVIYLGVRGAPDAAARSLRGNLSGIALVNALTGVANVGSIAPRCCPSAAPGDGDGGMGHFQDMDQVTLARPVTKFSRSIDCAARVLDILDEALGIATADPPGPVRLCSPWTFRTPRFRKAPLCH